MKKVLSISILLALATSCYSQGPPNSSNTDSITKKGSSLFISPEIMPVFSASPGSFSKYLSDNIKYPIIEREMGYQGEVIASFVIEIDGSVSNIRITKEVKGAPGFTKEAIRVLQAMPKWTPGQFKGKTVRISLVQSIKFSLDGKASEIKKEQLYFGEKISLAKFPTYSLFSFNEKMISKPSFPGGAVALRQYVIDHYSPPKNKNFEHNSVYLDVDFIVDTAGQICNITLPHECFNYFLDPYDSTVMEILKKMPAWIPGELQNRKINIVMSIRFFTADHTKNPPIAKINLRPEAFRRINDYKLPTKFGEQVNEKKLHVISDFGIKKAPYYLKKYTGVYQYFLKGLDSLENALGYTVDQGISFNFIVKKNGKLINIMLSSGCGKGMGDEFNTKIGQLLSVMPRWKPGRKWFRKRNVNVWLSINPAELENRTRER